ncbi:HNH endonuclease [Vogesella fluminis]|uniref:HNH endonuclease n=1 Tax=Vogesella fluminis TaxID=1069161 RepID=UPI001E4773D2|nr:HNH endonuclease [Vogesella fluminis]
MVVQRVGQDIFRQALIDYWQGRCAVTGLDVVPLLRASHIKPWADCVSDAERLDVFNGLLLAPHLDALFDGGWVTFLDSGGIQISERLDVDRRALMGLSGAEVISGLTEQHRAYLEWHREHCFR